MINPNEGEALRRGAVEKGGRGRGGLKGGKFYLGGVELIKCIDPNEGEALRRGGRGREGRGAGGGEGGREGRVGHSGQKEILPEGGIDQMY